MTPMPWSMRILFCPAASTLAQHKADMGPVVILYPG